LVDAATAVVVPDVVEEEGLARVDICSMEIVKVKHVGILGEVYFVQGGPHFVYDFLYSLGFITICLNLFIGMLKYIEISQDGSVD